MVFYFFMTGQPLIYHPTADYKHTSPWLPRGFARPRRLHGPAGSLGQKPQQPATAWTIGDLIDCYFDDQ